MHIDNKMIHRCSVAYCNPRPAAPDVSSQRGLAWMIQRLAKRFNPDRTPTASRHAASHGYTYVSIFLHAEGRSSNRSRNFGSRHNPPCKDFAGRVFGVIRACLTKKEASRSPHLVTTLLQTLLPRLSIHIDCAYAGTWRRWLLIIDPSTMNTRRPQQSAMVPPFSRL